MSLPALKELFPEHFVDGPPNFHYPPGAVSHAPDAVNAWSSEDWIRHQLPSSPPPSSMHSQHTLRLASAKRKRDDTPQSPHADERVEQDVGDIDGKRHLCPQCGKRFNRPSSLMTHLNTHTGAKPFECPFPGCGRHFNVSSNMRRHYRTHPAPAEPASRYHFVPDGAHTACTCPDCPPSPPWTGGWTSGSLSPTSSRSDRHPPWPTRSGADGGAGAHAAFPATPLSLASPHSAPAHARRDGARYGAVPVLKVPVPPCRLRQAQAPVRAPPPSADRDQFPAYSYPPPPPPWPSRPSSEGTLPAL